MKKLFPYGRVVVDWETDGLSAYDGARPFICGMEDEAGNVLKYRRGDAGWWKVKSIFESEKVGKIAHNLKFEKKMAWHEGWNPRGRWWDTMARAVLVNEYTPLSLDALSTRYFDAPPKDVVKNWIEANKRRFKKEHGRDPNYSDVPKDLLEPYLEGDLDRCLKLEWLLGPLVDKDPQLEPLFRMECELASEIAEMEDHGLWIDVPYVRAMLKRFEPELGALRDKLGSLAGVSFNPNSPAQLSRVLEALGYDTGDRGKPTEKDPEGLMSTDAELLELLPPNAFVDTLLRYRTIQKIVSTYLIPFTQIHGEVLHGSLWQFGKDKAIVTGRLSSSDPNLQNIPGAGSRGITRPLLRELGPAVRRAIVPPPGHDFLFFDFKQIEMVIFSCQAGDPQVVDFIKKGGDVYVAHGKLALGAHAFDGLSGDDYKAKRASAKELILSFVYGMGIRRFAQKVNISFQEAKSRRDAYFRNSPATKRMMLETTRDLLVHGFVRDLFGRKYHVPRDFAYKAVNALCQGPAATVMKRGILRMRALKALGAKPVLTVHDELIVAAPKNRVREIAEEGKRLMEEPVGVLPVPIKVDVEWSEHNWSDKKKIPGLE